MLEQAETLASGTVVGRLRLERVVGEGGMGVVWAARELGTERPLALKFLRDVRRNDPASHARFMREARAAMSVRHPNVAPVHAIEVTPAGTPYLVMDLLEGETLRRRLRRGSPLSLGETARILGPVVSAVRAAHDVGVVHRDLKPENIFLSTRGVLVVDFGIAKTLPMGGVDPTSITSTGAMIGTPIYMAPEQIFGEPDIDGRVDIWALGVILYECLSGIRPTEGAGVGQVLKIITSGSIPPLEQRLLQPVPPELCRFVMAMLSRRREDRPPLAMLSNLLAPLASVPEVSGRLESGAPTLDTHPPIQTTMQGVGSTRAPQTTQAKSSFGWLLLLLLLPAVALTGVLGFLGVQRYLELRQAAPSSTAAAAIDSSAPALPISQTAFSTPAAASGVIVQDASTPATHAAHASPPPIAHPSASTAASVAPDSGAYRFLLYQGKQAGIGTKSPEIIAAVQSAQSNAQTCFPPPGPDTLWHVALVIEWPKGGGHRTFSRAERNGEAQTSPMANQLAECVRAKVEAVKIPDADGQADMPNGTSSYGFSFGWAHPI